MDLLNEQNSSHNLPKEAQSNDQSDSSTVFVNSPTTSIPDDMELNEEQLDIISGGGDGSIILVKG